MAKGLITGANRGIGLETVKRLVEAGWEMTALCRNTSDELEAMGANLQIVKGVDVTDADALSTAVENLEGPYELVINNAGILIPDDLGGFSAADIEKQFLINALAPLQLSRLLLPKMSSPSKLVMITSRMGSIADNSGGGQYGYRMSKAALNAASMSLSIDLKEKGISVGIFHPGWVKTDMTDHRGHLTAEEVSKRIMRLIGKLGLHNSGRFLHSDGSRLPW